MIQQPILVHTSYSPSRSKSNQCHTPGKNNFILLSSAMATTREDGDEYTWVLLFTTTIEEGGDGHRYGDTFVL